MGAGIGPNRNCTDAVVALYIQGVIISRRPGGGADILKVQVTLNRLRGITTVPLVKLEEINVASSCANAEKPVSRAGRQRRAAKKVARKRSQRILM